MSKMRTSLKWFTVLSLSLSILGACASVQDAQEESDKVGQSQLVDTAPAHKPEAPLAELSRDEANLPGQYPERKKREQLASGISAPAPASLHKTLAPGESEQQVVHNTENYSHISENRFLETLKNPLSTFSIDVDTAAYSNVRRFIEQQNQLPPADAVRIEELVNYFPYLYPEPKGEHPFAVVSDVAECPWQPGNKLVRIGLKGQSIDFAKSAPNNLVFLIDVSGSMDSPNRLPLLKRSLKLLVDQMREEDHISIVVYAGAAGVVLPPTSGARREAILEALDRLQAGGSTAGAAGLQLAYDTAQKHFRKDGNNRIILATDGDFNVGQSSDGELIRLIEEKRRHGIFLTVLGYGMGNYKDNKMEQLANKGNGNYAYIDNLQEARKVLVQEMGSTLITIAKDVKLQLEFNPTKVSAYRLIGYENRLLAAEDFDDDKKDAGELGAGTTVTALYEVVPATGQGSGHELKYQQTQVKRTASDSNELLTLKLRYKQPQSDTSTLMTHVVADQPLSWSAVPADFRFAAAVAGFGMQLRKSEHKGRWTFEDVIGQARQGLGNDPEGYRLSFVKLAQQAQLLRQTD